MFVLIGRFSFIWNVPSSVVVSAMNYSGDLPTLLAYGAVCLSIMVGLLSLYLVMYFMVSCENAALDIEECYVPVADLMTPIQPVTWYSIQVAVVADFFKIRPYEVLNEYLRDATARKWIVRHSFPRNELTTKFLNKFRSRFLKKGYDMNAMVSKTVLALSKEGRKKKKKS
ncbi:hypothetical protein Y032_0051g2124 [Ancylostoma ceylanicum]|uniref:Uncharacterized protein n=2 Tax=Ancylostoma ceylanicum TaxID=53326 RepID=A0A016U8M8_9BILA|nr:hypothetical protein Y032_0051g2124 [Ancylostoma ceylanicum]